MKPTIEEQIAAIEESIAAHRNGGAGPDGKIDDPTLAREVQCLEAAIESLKSVAYQSTRRPVVE